MYYPYTLNDNLACHKIPLGFFKAKLAVIIKI